jgi:fructokinase
MRALAFGEILYDIIDGDEYLGGAPLNLAAHLSRCGIETAYVSRVGDDERGRRALGEMLGLEIRNDFMQIDSRHPTGTVDVVLSAGGQPAYTINENVAYDHIEPMENASVIIAYAPRVVCFGTLVQRSEKSRKSLYAILDRLPGIEMLYDVNLRQAFYDRAWIERSLWYATIVKLNDKEVGVLGQLLFGKELELEAFAERLAEQWELKAVLLTLGAEGCHVFAEGSHTRCGGKKIEVADTVGSGDAFSAGFLLGYLQGKTAAEAAQTGNALGAYVASMRGAIPEYDEMIRKELAS